MNSKAPGVILFLILFAFVLRGMLMIILIPAFFGPDEDVHFSTIQYLAQPAKEPTRFDEFPKYRYSNELNVALEVTEFFKTKPMSENSIEFTDGQYNGKNEHLLKGAALDRINRFPDPRISTYPPLYYSLNVPIEKAADSLDILSRIALMRMISIAIGILTLIVAYFSAKEIGFSRNESFLFTAILSFQPMFLFISSVINPDILLIFAFTLFIYGSLLLLHRGFSVRSIAIMGSGMLIGLFTKGPAMILPVVAVITIFCTLVETRTIRLRWMLLGSGLFIVLASVILFLTPLWTTIAPNILNSSSQFSSPFVSLKEYFIQTTDYEHIILQTTLSYWGNFGWLDAPISQQVTLVIFSIEILAAIGVVIFFLQKGHRSQKRDVVFLLFMLAALQILVRYYDWHLFDNLGRLELNTQGRYFFPNIFAHLYLLLLGLCMLFRQRMTPVLHVALMAMMSFYTYSTLLIIIPRFYW